MPYSFGEITAAEIANRDADKPILGAQAIPVTPDFIGWNTAGTVAGGDSSATTNPAARAIDGLVHLDTKPSAGNNPIYLVMEFPFPGITIDFLGIIGHNLGTLGATVDLEIADDAAFSTNLITLSSMSPSDDTRIQDFVLRHGAAAGTDANRYTKVEYARLAISGTGQVPAINELVLGRRRQLKHKPRTPYDDVFLDGDSETNVSAGGVRQRFVYNSGRFVLSANINPSKQPYLADIPAWFRTAERYGTAPFVWVENPGTDDSLWHYLQMDDPVLSYPVQDFVERTFSITAHEQGPERFYLERE